VRTSQPDGFDLAVVGGGHAGVEAALAAARLGCRVALLTHDPAKIGAMSCNPAVGGLGKGHLVKEIDALGGLMGRAADRAAIQFRRLNLRKGPAVRASRVQVDRSVYARAVKAALRRQVGLRVLAGEAVDIWLDGRAVRGLILADGARLAARAVVLTTGTFLGGLIHIGRIRFPAGRLGDPPSLGLSRALNRLGLETGRLKTGTPARLLKASIDFSRLTPQPGDETPRPLSILSRGQALPQVACHLTRTTARTHEIIRANLKRSALYGGAITGTGTRYCPSIEDKIVKFPDRTGHQVFLEPEGLNSDLVYPNGISTSLPLDVQEAFIRSLPGLERAVLARPAYAIEYDYVNPRQLGPDLMVRSRPGLFLAGQINGTSGYEEAGAQGLLAGLNAARWLKGLPLVSLGREQAYLGVMVDDLTTLGTDEPYRMFTSRAEYRLLLREDNAAERLTPLGRDWGLVGERQWAAFNRRAEARERARRVLAGARLRPSAEVGARLTELGSAALGQPLSLAELLRRPELSFESLRPLLPGLPLLEAEAVEAVEVEIKYAGYLARQEEQVRRYLDLEGKGLPQDLDYASLAGLSREVAEKLSRVRPRSLGQAARIPGMTPAALMLLSVLARRVERAA